jgi:hypothetical protein
MLTKILGLLLMMPIWLLICVVFYCRMTGRHLSIKVIQIINNIELPVICSIAFVAGVYLLFK